MSQMMRPSVKSFAGSKTDATIGQTITSSTFVDVGSILRINGFVSPTLFLEELSGTEAADVQVLLSPDFTKPSATSGMFVLSDTAGNAVNVAVAASSKVLYPLQSLAANWIALQGKKGGVGSSTKLRALMAVGAILGSDRRTVMTPKLDIASVAVALTATEAIIGSPAKVRGLSNLTLFVENTDATVAATLKVYASFADSMPSNMLQEFPYSDASAVISITAPANSKVAVPIDGIVADWLAVSGSGNGADVKISVMGSPAGAGGY